MTGVVDKGIRVWFTVIIVGYMMRTREDVLERLLERLVSDRRELEDLILEKEGELRDLVEKVEELVKMITILEV